MPPTLQSRFRGVLLGGFVGDALGAPFEGTPVGALARLALHAFMSAPLGLPAIVTHAVQFGGDTDTIGAMTGALAGAVLGDTAIPTNWLAALENGPRGRDHVLRLADDLFTQWHARHHG